MNWKEAKEHDRQERTLGLRRFARGDAVTPDEQLELWKRGEPRCPNDRGECCPDFSCCRPMLLWPAEKREAFCASTQDVREQMMLGSLQVTSGASVVTGAGETEACADCGKLAELRPYGPGFSRICFECGLKDPEGTRARAIQQRGLA